MLNDFVDKTFVVNLFERPERLKDSTMQLDHYGVRYTVWPASKNQDGRLGLRITMSELLSYCWHMDFKRVCVFEDDIKILRNDFTEIIDKCIAQVPKHFDLLYLGGNVWKTPTRVSPNIIRTPAIYSTHAVIYTRGAIEKIIPYLSKYRAYDEVLVNRVQNPGNCYCAFPLLVSQIEGFSDIEKKVVNYEGFIERRFYEKTKGL